MTTIREKSTAALAEALTKTVPWLQLGHGGTHNGNGSPGCPRTRHHHHDEKCDPGGEILAASPTLAADLDLAIAWREAVAALPEGWVGPSLHRRPEGHWRAYAVQESLLRPMPVHADGPTPTEALVALAEALRERAR